MASCNEREQENMFLFIQLACTRAVFQLAVEIFAKCSNDKLCTPLFTLFISYITCSLATNAASHLPVVHAWTPSLPAKSGMAFVSSLLRG